MRRPKVAKARQENKDGGIEFLQPYELRINKRSTINLGTYDIQKSKAHVIVNCANPNL